MSTGFYIQLRSSVHITYIMFQSSHLISAIFQQFVCHRYYMVYIFTCLSRRLGYKQFLYFLLYVNSLKKFFVSKTKFNCFYKMSIFSYSQLPKILKLWRSSLRLVFLIKIVCNQFLLLKNFTSSVLFDLFPLIWDLLYLISPQSHKFLIGVESFEIL